MDYRRTSQAVEWAVVAAVVAIHVLIAVESQRRSDVLWLQFASDAQPVTAIALVTAWAFLGPGRLRVRAVVAPILVAVWSLGVPWQDPQPYIPVEPLLPLPYAIAGAMVLVFAVVRLTGLRMTGLLQSRPEPRPQFSIRALLLATTMVAAGIGGLELLRPTIIEKSVDAAPTDLIRLITRIDADGTYGVHELAVAIRQCVLSLAVAGAAAGGLIAVSRPGALWLRLAILTVGLPALSLYLTHLAGIANNTFQTRTVELTGAFAAVAVLVGISELPVRLFGYRLIGHSADVKAAQHAHASMGPGTPEGLVA